MDAQSIPRPEDDSVSQTLLGETASLLAGRWRDLSPDFLTALYGHNVADDVAHYRPEELAAIAEQAWSFLLERKPGAPKIGFAPARLTPGIAVLDILNDDMPVPVQPIEKGPIHQNPGARCATFPRPCRHPSRPRRRLSVQRYNHPRSCETPRAVRW